MRSTRKPDRWSDTHAGIRVEELIRAASEALERSGVWFGHGTDNAVDDAAELVFFACGLRHDDAEQAYQHRLTEAELTAAVSLLDRRIDERIPTAYLTRRMWFAGHEFYVDERVLVPRSPIAELIAAQFSPWVDAVQVRNVIDVGTGSGCIAIACALAFPGASVDACDISEDALEVTRINIDRFDLRSRVEVRRSDVFEGVGARRYDIIVSNPPYVGAQELASLPVEYAKEPQIGLRGGADGLDIVRRILSGASEHLRPGGILVVEVGNTEAELVDAYPRVPFTWLDFAHGGGGVFLLTAEQVAEIDR